MTRVDFYVLESRDEGDRERTACRLTEKAWRQGHRVYLHTASGDAARALDDLLWTFRQESFVPHSIARGADEMTMVTIGEGGEPEGEIDVLVNLCDQIPTFAARSTRLAEIVAGDDARRDVARDRFREYRERGYEIESHNL